MSNTSPKVVMVPITHIRPYWRNPRINDEAVHAVSSSLKRYGFQTPMVLDLDMEIIAGHCRYRAAQSLGLTEVPCVVVDLPDNIAKQLRIIDNKTAEFAKWDNEKLEEELKGLIDIAEVRELFTGPEWASLFADLPAADAATAHAQGTASAGADTKGTSSGKAAKGETEEFEVPCPHCGETQTYKVRDNRVIDKDQADIQKRTDAERGESQASVNGPKERAAKKRALNKAKKEAAETADSDKPKRKRKRKENPGGGSEVAAEG